VITDADGPGGLKALVVAEAGCNILQLLCQVVEYTPSATSIAPSILTSSLWASLLIS
jgi:hypothetical protein